MSGRQRQAVTVKGSLTVTAAARLAGNAVVKESFTTALGQKLAKIAGRGK